MTRFQVETDQASRWLAYALLDAENGFKRISGCEALPELIAALQRAQPELPEPPRPGPKPPPPALATGNSICDEVEGRIPGLSAGDQQLDDL